jgi:hypothetical protein
MQVKKVPKTFNSLDGYLQSFILPLIEETRADLCSALEGIRHAPAAEVTRMVQLDEEQDIFRIGVKNADDPKLAQRDQAYVPKDADLLVLTDRRPRHSSELGLTGKPYLLCSVLKAQSGDGTVVRLSRSLGPAEGLPLFAVFLVNMTTYNRILNALDARAAACRNTSLIEKTLDPKV